MRDAKADSTPDCTLPQGDEQDEGLWELASLDDARRTAERELYESRAFLRDAAKAGVHDAHSRLSGPGLNKSGAEGCVLLTCRDYILPLMLAKGRELLREGERGFSFETLMRRFKDAELARLEEIHWQPLRAEFGDDCYFTKREVQERFEDMIRRELEGKVLPYLAKADNGHSIQEPGDAEHAAFADSELDALKARRRAEIDALIMGCAEAGRTIERKDIYEAAGYTGPTDFERFQRADPRTSKAAHRTFSRILKNGPEALIQMLKKREQRALK